MAFDGAFSPLGDTFSVSTTIVQATTRNNAMAPNYRIRCLASGYISWATQQVSAQPPAFTAAAPSPGTPKQNTFGMTTGQVEVFNLPGNAYFLSSVSEGFEVTPGEGL